MKGAHSHWPLIRRFSSTKTKFLRGWDCEHARQMGKHFWESKTVRFWSDSHFKICTVWKYFLLVIFLDWMARKSVGRTNFERNAILSLFEIVDDQKAKDYLHKLGTWARIAVWIGCKASSNPTPHCPCPCPRPFCMVILYSQNVTDCVGMAKMPKVHTIDC